MSTHTPGPWTEVGRYIETDEYTICEMFSPRTREERDANQRLIAAAPELLEALKALTVAVTFADPPKEFNGALCHEARVPVGFVDAARAAIKKAEEVKP